MRKKMFMGKMTPLDDIYIKDFKLWNFDSSEIITLNHNNYEISGVVIETVKKDYHLIITKDNNIIDVNWSENTDKINNYIFNDYNFSRRVVA